MPYGDPDPQDPNILIGVLLPAHRDSLREMAATFAEEFAALGYSADRLIALFRDPFYTGAHQAFRILGAQEIQRIVEESLRVWGNHRIGVQDTAGVEAAVEEERCPT